MSNRLKIRLDRIELQIRAPRVIYNVPLGASKDEHERTLAPSGGGISIGPNDRAVALFMLPDDVDREQRTEVTWGEATGRGG